MIEVRIKKKLQDFLLDISFTSDGGCLGMLGASGSGKSMTLKCIAGIERPDEGYIAVNGRVLFDSKKRINLTPQQRKVGYMFQNYALFPNMTVEENIAAGIYDKKHRKTEIAIQMERFQLEGLEKRYPGQLSGGQQQRVALARMMAHRPEVILLDEPFSALDGYLKEKLQHEMMGVLNEYNGDILLVSHSRDDIYRFCPMVLTVDAGSTLQIGPIWEIFMNPKNYKVARLTGCNNISPVKKTGPRELLALDWDIHLKTDKEVSDNIRYVGIRSHDIILADKKEENMSPAENRFSMELLDVVESPFEYKYHVKASGRNPVEAIWCKTYKDLDRNATPESFPRNIRIPKEKLLLLEE